MDLRFFLPAFWTVLVACGSAGNPPTGHQDSTLQRSDSAACGVLTGACSVGTTAHCDEATGQWQCVASEDAACGVLTGACPVGTTAHCDEATGQWQCVASKDGACGVLTGACPVGTTAHCDDTTGQWECLAHLRFTA